MIIEVKKIVFLGDTLTGKIYGIQRYAYEIIKELDALDPQYDCEVVIPENSDIAFDFKNIKVVKYGKKKNGFLWRQIYYSNYVSRKNVISVDLTLGLILCGSDFVCLHDCIYENYPKEFIGFKNKVKRLSYLLRAKINIRKAKKIITVSENSRNDIAKYYGIDKKDIAVIYNAWQHFDEIELDNDILNKLGLAKGGYYFSLGSRLPHKNFKWIVEVAKKYNDEKFVITGDNILNSGLHDIKEIGSNVMFTGYLSDSEVKTLMTYCKAFLYPSLYEGFGIPPMEALSCGAKIIISNATSLPEIYGESAQYFDPRNYDIDLKAMLTKDNLNKRELILNKYTWKKSAYILNGLLRNAMMS